jgi:hypothetical protein
MEETSAEVESTCQSTTKDGSRCTRSVADGRHFCWQHARGPLAKWHSLTRSQTVAFYLAVFGVLATIVLGIIPLLPWTGAGSKPNAQPDGRAGRTAATSSYAARANIEVVRIYFGDWKHNFKTTNPLQEDKPFYLRLVFDNNGESPANNLGAVVRIKISSSDPTEYTADEETIWQIIEKEARGYSGPNSMGPEKESAIDVQYPLAVFNERALTQREINQIKRGTRHIILAGVMNYRDDISTRQTRICQVYSGPSWRYWMDCTNGHNQIASP